jgi:hypothetical protein
MTVEDEGIHQAEDDGHEKAVTVFKTGADLVNR